jgi:hypothetical protein
MNVIEVYLPILLKLAYEMVADVNMFLSLMGHGILYQLDSDLSFAFLIQDSCLLKDAEAKLLVRLLRQLRLGCGVGDT